MDSCPVAIIDYITIGCAIEGCDQCKESDHSALGECTACANSLVLDQGKCYDSKLHVLDSYMYHNQNCPCILTDCGITNCISCDKVDIMICVRCQTGYRQQQNGECSGKL